MINRIAVLTGGGDCPGLNAVIRAVVRTAVHQGIEVIGIKDGFRGAVEEDFVPLGLKEVSGILPRVALYWNFHPGQPLCLLGEVNGQQSQEDRSVR
jgi:6-phosphofructokinase 1